MTTNRTRRAQQGFTLIELLTVLTVIGVLAGMLLAGVSGARKKAEELQAKATISALTAALRQFHTEYGHWPKVQAAGEGEVVVDRNMVGMLTGSNILGNTRSIVFQEFAPKLIDKKTGSLLTPWARKFQDNAKEKKYRHYYCVFDSNQDGTVKAGSATNQIRMAVAVWTTQAKPDRMIGSW
jgi:prepilin-type N-terminal cleavage/methylation domain-containing protein